MKKILFLIIALQYSCTADVNITQGQSSGPFVGDYIGTFNCIDELESENGDEFEVEITLISNDNYEIEIEDDLILGATLENEILVLPMQDIDQLFGLDNVTINGTITMLDNDNLNFDFFIDSDDGETSCVTILEED